MYRVAQRFHPAIGTESINRSRRSYYRAMIIRRPMVSGRTACAETVNDGAIRGHPILGSGRRPKELRGEPPEAALVEGEACRSSSRPPFGRASNGVVSGRSSSRVACVRATKRVALATTSMPTSWSMDSDSCCSRVAANASDPGASSRRPG